MSRMDRDDDEPDGSCDMSGTDDHKISLEDEPDETATQVLGDKPNDEADTVELELPATVEDAKGV